MKIQPSLLVELVSGIFSAVGASSAEAACVAQHLVHANLAGHDSHGVIRTPIYLRWRQEEKVFPNRQPKELVDLDNISVFDGQMGFGQWIGQQVIQRGIEKCHKHNLALVALRNVGHLGRIGHYAEMAAAEKLIALLFVNTSGLGMHVVPAGGGERRLSVNPVCIGFPNRNSHPVVLDIAAAATAEGKLKVARNKGVPVPEGWIVDAEGRATTDPNLFYGPPGGAILPFGGHKGYGLNLMAELLAGARTGSGCSAPGKTRLEQGMLAILIKPAALGDENAFASAIARYIDFVKSSQPTDPERPVLAPGDIEASNHATRSAGIELDDTTWQQLLDAARDSGVDQELTARIESSLGR